MKKILKNEMAHAGCCKKMANQGVASLIGIAILFFAMIKIHAQNSQTNNFTSVEYYPAPDETQMKSQLSGADAEPAEDGLLIIKQLDLKMFATNGETQVIIRAPDCVYDLPNHLANSAGKIYLQNGDGKIRAEGKGFLWRQTESSLTISNDVKTLIAGVALAAATSLNAQTNSIAPTNSVRAATHISSRTGDFDLNKRNAIYSGNVVVTDPEMKLTCEWLIADLPQSGQINHIVAETNVVIDFKDSKGQMTHATGEKAVYNYKVENGTTNETVTLTGNPQVDNSQGHTTADKIIWDRINNSFRFINPHATIEHLQGLTNSPPATNQLKQKIKTPKDSGSSPRKQR